MSEDEFKYEFKKLSKNFASRISNNTRKTKIQRLRIECLWREIEKINRNMEKNDANFKRRNKFINKCTTIMWVVITLSLIIPFLFEY